MSSRTPLADFLRARRAALRPERIGLTTAGTRRRVPGLRREEVADRARISRDYYLRVEQGHDITPSDQVLGALAQALDLDEFERAYLFRVARPLPPRAASSRSHPSMEALLEHWPMTPAFAFDRNLDVLATNDLLRCIAPEKGVPGANLLLSVAEGYASAREDGIPEDQLQVWDSIFRELIAALRFYSDPDDARLQEIVGECSVRYRLFRSVWAEYEVRPITQRALRIDVAPFGWLDFDMQTFESAVAPGRFVVTYLARAGSPAAAAVDHFASLRPAARRAEAHVTPNAAVPGR
ncbi:helix-turn-helix transcriptional regulator [Rathayibacter sp. SD072]|uniref:helix-turn-helix transcriptional regulator n=1 Tax=Rathayibacter sp. SD072 TaxID=2781731 RepID=UPI001A97301F|nr:helix-turn-helix transcriptional regulator [Rathayibacter sp. SD072]MBO0985132.1 helix-turn-helix domain-containing protein [Rathayibacter sp. SD072]